MKKPIKLISFLSFLVLIPQVIATYIPNYTAGDAGDITTDILGSFMAEIIAIAGFIVLGFVAVWIIKKFKGR